MNNLHLRIFRIQHIQSAAESAEPQFALAVIDSTHVVTRDNLTLLGVHVDTQHTRGCSAPEDVIHNLYIAHLHSVAHYLGLIPFAGRFVPTDDVHSPAVRSYTQCSVSCFFDVIHIRVVGGDSLTRSRLIHAFAFRAVEHAVARILGGINTSL